MRCEVWGGCAWINLNDDAPPLRSCIEPFATVHDAWKVESLRTEWWHASRLPVNWKLAEEAFMEQYHVIETHPELVITKRFAPKDPAAFDPEVFIDAELHYLHVMSEGMGGMVHANDVRVAEGLRTIELPATRMWPCSTWLARSTTRWWAGTANAGRSSPTSTISRRVASTRPMGYCFPHYFMLPMYSSATLVPLPPARARGDADGDLVAHPVPGGPRARAAGAARGLGVRRRALAAHPHAGLLEPAAAAEGPPRQGLRVHAPVRRLEGGIANFERTLDGFLAGLPYEKLLPALRVGQREPAREPVVDLGSEA